MQIDAQSSEPFHALFGLTMPADAHSETATGWLPVRLPL
jgi:hypothetical protein